MTDLVKTKYQWLYTKADDHDLLHYIKEVDDWDDEFFDTYETQFDGARLTMPGFKTSFNFCSVNHAIYFLAYPEKHWPDDNTELDIRITA